MISRNTCTSVQKFESKDVSDDESVRTEDLEEKYWEMRGGYNDNHRKSEPHEMVDSDEGLCTHRPKNRIEPPSRKAETIRESKFSSGGYPRGTSKKRIALPNRASEFLPDYLRNSNQCAPILARTLPPQTTFLNDWTGSKNSLAPSIRNRQIGRKRSNSVESSRTEEVEDHFRSFTGVARMRRPTVSHDGDIREFENVIGAFPEACTPSYRVGSCASISNLKWDLHDGGLFTNKLLKANNSGTSHFNNNRSLSLGKLNSGRKLITAEEIMAKVPPPRTTPFFGAKEIPQEFTNADCGESSNFKSKTGQMSVDYESDFASTDARNRYCSSDTNPKHVYKYEAEATEPPETEIEDEANAVATEFRRIQRQLQREQVDRKYDHDMREQLYNRQQSNARSPRKQISSKTYPRCRSASPETGYRIRPKPRTRQSIAHSRSRSRYHQGDSCSPLRKQKLFEEKDDLHRSVMELREEKKSICQELSSLQQDLWKNRREAKVVESQVKGAHYVTEDLRSSLRMAEMHRNEATRELNCTADDISRKKQQLINLEMKLDTKRRDIEEIASLGVDVGQIKSLVEKHSAVQSLLEEKTRKNNDLAMQKAEIEMELSKARDQLVSEQKRGLWKLEQLRNDVETTERASNEGAFQREELGRKVRLLQENLDQAEKEHARLEKEKSQELSKVQDRFEGMMQAMEANHRKETTLLNEKVKDLISSSEELRKENSNLNGSLRKQTDQNEMLQEQLMQEMRKRGIMEEKFNKENENLKKHVEGEKDLEREQALEDKKKALAEMRVSLEMEREAAIRLYEDRINQIRTEHRADIILHQQEITDLKNQLVVKEENYQNSLQVLHQETSFRVENAIRNEREACDVETKSALRKQAEESNRTHDQSVNDLKMELQTERGLSEQLRAEIINLTKELENCKVQSQNTYLDTVQSLNRAREMAREERAAELGKMREIWNKENTLEVSRLQGIIRSKDEEIKNLKEEKKNVTQNEKDINTILQRQEKTILHEINEECRRTALVLGITPRRVRLYGLENSDNFSVKDDVKGKDFSGKRNASQTTISALANLRAHNEELRSYANELQQESDILKQNMDNIKTQKEAEIVHLRSALQQEKFSELEQMKQKLIKDHVREVSSISKNDATIAHKLRESEKTLNDLQRSMSAWKEETAQRLTKNLRKEIRNDFEKRHRGKRDGGDKSLEKENSSLQREIDRLQREITRLKSMSSPLQSAGNGLYPDEDSIRTLRNLQNRVKQLRSENAQLNGKYPSEKDKYDATSKLPPYLMPFVKDQKASFLDGASRADDAYIQLLEQRMKAAEMCAVQALEKCHRQEELVERQTRPRSFCGSS